MKHLNHDLSVQDRIGLKLASRLSEATDSLPHDITERLRVARMQALNQHHLLVQTAMTPSINSRDGTATLSWRGHGLWHRVTAFIPLLALIAGLIAVQFMETDSRAKELAEIDAAILTDDLPPSAYTDSGFTQFLKLHHDANQ